MTNQGTTVRATIAVVGNGYRSVLGNHFQIEIDQPLSGDSWGICTHAVGSVAHGTTEAISRNVQAMTGEG